MNAAAPAIDYGRYFELLHQAATIRPAGRVVEVVGLTVESEGPAVNVGETCIIERLGQRSTIIAEAVGIRKGRLILMPFGDTSGIGPGCVVAPTGGRFTVPVGEGLLGRVINGLGRPIDNKGELPNVRRQVVDADPPPPMSRPRIDEHISTGIRAIDTLLAMGRGQRMGIFAGSGVGKSTLLGMIARNSDADVIVIGLVGERGKEVRDFLDRDLGPEALKRTVMVVSTSDRPSLERLKGAFVATAVAEYFRDQGKNVMLLIDSITRLAMAQREVGLTAGEPPTTRGYPPSVFAMMPRLLERAGRSAKGSITGIYSVLVEGDDFSEPVADTVRSILDGHIVLSRRLASQNHYPAIDILDSVSRVAPEVTPQDKLPLTNRFKDIMATYREAEDLINIGAYKPGASPEIDLALKKISPMRKFLRQGIFETADPEDGWQQLVEVLKDEGIPVPAGEGPANSRNAAPAVAGRVPARATAAVRAT
jgi:flagellum-specific ATP synthase